MALHMRAFILIMHMLPEVQSIETVKFSAETCEEMQHHLLQGMRCSWLVGGAQPKSCNLEDDATHASVAPLLRTPPRLHVKLLRRVSLLTSGIEKAMTEVDMAMTS